MRTVAADIERFYRLLRVAQDRKLFDSAGADPWPIRGVYFFFESGEARATHPGGLSEPRVVRVGTHAVSSNSKSTLWGRLRTHRGSRHGGGNHRGSIFRLHVGAALLARDGVEPGTWGRGSSATKEIRTSEVGLEQAVSKCISAMRVSFVAVPDEPGPKSARAVIERNSIALLSNVRRSSDPPSPGWLGRHSPRPEIVESGLWNLNYVDDRYDPGFLDVLESFVRAPRV